MEQTVLLKFEVDQGNAEKQLIAVNKSLLNNKKAQQDLSAAYKKGTITQDEYVQENIRLQNTIKKEQQESAKLTKLIQTESNSRNALKIKVGDLAKEYDNLNTETTEGAKRAQELQKELTQLNNQINKGSEKAGLFKDQIGNYPKAFGDAAKEINVAGVSVGGLAEGFTSLLNPATATVAVIGALGAAYARSTIGAKDLSFASNELGEVTTILTNKFAGLISSAEDGEGALTKLLNVSIGYVANQTLFGNALKLFGLNLNDVAKQAKETALALEQIEDLERLLLQLRAQNNDRLEENQELITEINQEETTYLKKVADANKIIENLKTNETNLLGIEKAELSLLQKRLDADKENEELQTAVLQKKLDIADIEKNTTKQIEKTKKMLDNINEAEAKRIEQQKEKVRIFTQEANAFVNAADKAILEKFTNVDASYFGEGDVKQAPKELNPATGRDKASELDANALAKEQKDTLKVYQEVYGEKADLYNKDTDAYISTVRSKLEVQYELQTGELKLSEAYADITNGRSDTYSQDAQNYINAQVAKQKANQDFISSLGNDFTTLAGLFKKGSDVQKAFALATIFTNEAKAISGLVAASENNPLNAVTEGGAGLAQYATGFTEIIANIGAAISILNEGFASGGYTGYGGKYEPKGVVHGNEYVIPSETVNKFGASYFDKYLPGYADGGLVANRATESVNNSVLIANAFKNMPPIYTSVVEMTRASNRVQAKENYATLRK